MSYPAFARRLPMSTPPRLASSHSQLRKGPAGVPCVANFLAFCADQGDAVSIAPQAAMRRSKSTGGLPAVFTSLLTAPGRTPQTGSDPGRPMHLVVHRRDGRRARPPTATRQFPSGRNVPGRGRVEDRAPSRGPGEADTHGPTCARSRGAVRSSLPTPANAIQALRDRSSGMPNASFACACGPASEHSNGTCGAAHAAR